MPRFERLRFEQLGNRNEVYSATLQRHNDRRRRLDRRLVNVVGQDERARRRLDVILAATISESRFFQSSGSTLHSMKGMPDTASTWSLKAACGGRRRRVD